MCTKYKREVMLLIGVIIGMAVSFIILGFILTSNLYGNPIEIWVKRNEGLRKTMYLGPENNILIGYGHNLRFGIDAETAEFILYRDIQKAKKELRKIFSDFSGFPLNVRIVLVDMMCAMGPGYNNTKI